MGGRQGRTAALTARRTASPPPALLRVVRPAPPTCAWCGARFTPVKPNQRFCRPAHRTADNSAKWGRAAAAVWDVLTAGLMAGLYRADEIRSEQAVRQALAWCVDKRHPERQGRRAALMRDFGLCWVSEQRQWVKG